MGSPPADCDCAVIPTYPDALPLGLEHKDYLNALFGAQPVLVSEHSFSGLFLFAHAYDYALSKAEDSLIIRGVEHGAPFVIPVQALPSEHMLSQFLQAGIQIKAIPSAVKNAAAAALEHIQPSARGALTTDEGDADYIHKRSNLADLPGRKFHKKRNHVNYFTDHNEYHTLPLTAQTIPAARKVTEEWKERHGTPGDYEATLRALDNYEQLGLTGEVTFVGGKPAGFVIGEMRGNDGWCIIHFEKANTSYQGLFQFINQHFALSLPASCRVLNREQDLGDEGLRQAKRTYRPDALLKKYRIYPQASPIPPSSVVVHQT